MKRSLGLRGRLVGAVLALLAVLLVVIASVVVVRAERALSEVERARFLALTTQLADSAGYAVLAESPALLEPSLAAFARTPELCSVTVVDDEQAPLAERRGGACLLDDTVAIAVPVRTLASAPGDDEGELAAFGVGAAAPRTVGEVRAVFSRAAARDIEGRMRADIALAFLLFGGVGLCAVLALASHVVRRIRALAVASSRVARGELDVAVDGEGSDEIAQLARDFSSMTRALAAQRAALDDAAAALAERESLAAIGRATAVIAHEIRNPLGILLGAAEILKSEKRTAEQKLSAAEIVDDEVRRLDRSLKALLDYARPQAPRRERVEVKTLLERTIARATYAGGPAHGVTVDVNGVAAAVLVDEQQAGQVLLNLFANAAQAGAKHIVVVVAPPAARRVRIDVQDDGPGIDPGLGEQLFRPFVTTKPRGAGLGLAASRRMARDNGGDLSLASGGEPAGARFTLDLEEAAP